VLPSIERRRAALKQVLGECTDRRIIQRADTIGNRPAMLSIAFERDYQFRIAQHRNVSVVATSDDLSRALELPELLNDAVVDETVVEVVFRLVDDQRRGRSTKEKQ
jgi:hypothetical protein